MQLKVPQAQLVAKDGVISDHKIRKIKSPTASSRRDRKLNAMSIEATVKDPAQFKISGLSHTRHDGEAKVTGKAHYAADIRMPGMLYAKILRPPAHGATLKSVDTSAAKAVAGVQVIQDGDLIAVLHRISRRGGGRTRQNQGRVRHAGRRHTTTKRFLTI